MANYLGFEPKSSAPYYFISYNTEDKDVVTQYVVEMNRLGLPMWYDHGIHTGTQWEEVIAEHIFGCEAVVLFFSAGIFKKNNSYVRQEYLRAKERNKPIIVVLLDRIDDSTVPPKYAFWWGDIKDMQCIYVGDFATIGDCITKILSDLGKTPEGTPSVAPVPSAKPAAAPSTESPMTMLRRRIAECLPADEPISLSELEKKVGYPMSNPEATMLLRDMVDKKELGTYKKLYWSPSFDFRGRAKDSIVACINTSRDYVREEDLPLMHDDIGTFAEELPTMLAQLVDSRRISCVRDGNRTLYAPADYPERLAASRDFLLKALQEAGGYMSLLAFERLDVSNVYEDDRESIVSDLIEQGEVICGLEVIRLSSFDITDMAREKIIQIVECARSFVPVRLFRGQNIGRGEIRHAVSDELGLPLETVMGLLEELCVEERIVYIPAIDGLATPSFRDSWVLAYEDTSSYIKSDPLQLHTAEELIGRVNLPGDAADAMLSALVSDGVLEQKGRLYYVPGMLEEIVLWHFADRVKENGSMSAKEAEEILEGLCIASTLSSRTCLEKLCQREGLYWLREANTCFTQAACYQYLCERQARANSSATFSRLAGEFAGLGNYEDCPARAAECEKRAARHQQEETKRKEEKQRKEKAEARARAAEENSRRRREKMANVFSKMSILPALIVWFLFRHVAGVTVYDEYYYDEVPYIITRLVQVALFVWLITANFALLSRERANKKTPRATYLGLPLLLWNIVSLPLRTVLYIEESYFYYYSTYEPTYYLMNRACNVMQTIFFVWMLIALVHYLFKKKS